MWNMVLKRVCWSMCCVCKSEYFCFIRSPLFCIISSLFDARNTVLFQDDNEFKITFKCLSHSRWPKCLQSIKHSGNIYPFKICSPFKSQSVHATCLEWFIYIVRVDWQHGNCVDASEIYFNYNTPRLLKTLIWKFKLS